MRQHKNNILLPISFLWFWKINGEDFEAPLSEISFEWNNKFSWCKRMKGKNFKKAIWKKITNGNFWGIYLLTWCQKVHLRRRFYVQPKILTSDLKFAKRFQQKKNLKKCQLKSEQKLGFPRKEKNSPNYDKNPKTNFLKQNSNKNLQVSMEFLFTKNAWRAFFSYYFFDENFLWLVHNFFLFVSLFK